MTIFNGNFKWQFLIIFNNFGQFWTILDSICNSCNVFFLLQFLEEKNQKKLKKKNRKIKTKLSSHICSHSLFSGLSPPSDSPVGGSDSVFTKFALLSFLPILLPDFVFLSPILVPFDFLTTFILCAKLTNNQKNNNNSCMRMF